MKSGKSSVRLKTERTYLLSRPKFRLFRNAEYLDAERLSRGSHTIELGKFEGCHCDCVVTARIRNGMIKGVDYPKCESATKLTSKLARALHAASRKLRGGAQGKWQDVPVHEFARSAAVRARVVVVVTTSGDCYEVCVDPGTGLQTCWICCPGWCIGPSDPHLALF